MNKIIINPHYCSREEYQELKDYLTNKTWDWQEISDGNKKMKRDGTTVLQVNLHFGDHTMSACGMINKEMKLITANNFPTLLRRIKKSGIEVENLILTFQPE